MGNGTFYLYTHQNDRGKFPNRSNWWHWQLEKNSLILSWDYTNSPEFLHKWCKLWSGTQQDYDLAKVGERFY